MIEIFLYYPDRNNEIQVHQVNILLLIGIRQAQIRSSLSDTFFMNIVKFSNVSTSFIGKQIDLVYRRNLNIYTKSRMNDFLPSRDEFQIPIKASDR
jgi:hypothetical protein